MASWDGDNICVSIFPVNLIAEDAHPEAGLVALAPKAELLCSIASYLRVKDGIESPYQTVTFGRRVVQ